MSLAVLVPAMHSGKKGSIEAQSAATTFASQATPLASIDLYNPTASTAPVAVEVPVGSIAAPGVIDWANARLILDGKEVPYCIREGRVHWKARLTAPVTEPRAEDLLVFSTPLPTGTWVRANIVPGKRMTAGLTRSAGDCVVAYPKLRVLINKKVRRGGMPRRRME